MITRKPISAKFLLAAPPPAETVIPEGFAITKVPAKVAYGAHKPRHGSNGGAATTGAIHATRDRRATLQLATWSAQIKAPRR